MVIPIWKVAAFFIGLIQVAFKSRIRRNISRCEPFSCAVSMCVYQNKKEVKSSANTKQAALFMTSTKPIIAYPAKE